MKYDPAMHHRRSIRLRGYDYSQNGAYFITICCDQRKCRFGRIENGEMIMNEYGIIADEEWVNLTERFDNIEMDVFQIMPNHLHGIIAVSPCENHGAGANGIKNGAGATLAVAQNAVAPVAPGRRVTVGDIVGAYKSLVANACLKIYKSNHQTMGKLWQRNYWEHVVRDEDELSRIRNYIKHNPIMWEQDKLNDGPGNRVLETQTLYGEEPWMI